jgi:hypothetical protein
LAAFLSLSAFAAPASPDSLASAFANPPPDAHPLVRWWWFGPAVVKPELERELALMKEGGFGGFEVQPTYPLALDGQYPGLQNFKFGSAEFFDALRFTSGKAKDLGLRMDLTLGSGWPYGGPMFSRDEAAQSLADGGTMTIERGQTQITAPSHARRDSAIDPPVIAALLGPIAIPAPGESAYVPLEVTVRTAKLPADLRGATQVHFYTYAPAQLMRVKRAAYGAEGFIVDHYNPTAVEKFIRDIAQPEIAACAENAPYSIFCDSLEIAGAGWTPDFPAEFRRRRGYDLVPLLPALFDADFPHAAEIRGDYGRTLAEVFNDAFVDRFTRLARENHTRFRLQAYGTPPTTFETYARVDLDEGESHNWRIFTGTRWAASASHVLGRAVTSAEAFTWLHSPVFMAAPIDLKAESNLQFLNGVNQLLYHGWPYTAPGIEYPGWRFYAAGVFNEKNPWWLVMPDINRYFARTCQLLREGVPVNDVAIYLPEEDAFAAMTPSSLQMVGADGTGLLNRRVNDVVAPILNAGFNFDGIDAGVLTTRAKVDGATLTIGDGKYRAVVLPPMTHIEPAALRVLEQFANAGGVVVCVDRPPTLSPGLQNAEAHEAAIREISAHLFAGPHAKGRLVPLAELGASLAKAVQPDVVLTPASDKIGFVHRRVGATDLYFVANTSNETVSAVADFRSAAPHVAWWDATTGTRRSALVLASSDHATRVAIELPPYGADFLVFSDDTGPGGARTGSGLPAVGLAKRDPALHQQPLDLSTDWNVAFKNSAPERDPTSRHFANLTSWTDDRATRYFSGVATYTKQFEVPAAFVEKAAVIELDFGAGRAATVAGGKMGVRADFQPPIADAAVVYVNGQRADALWCPPYRIEVTALLHVGTNELRIEVANRASNYMADKEHHPLPDYKALNADPRLGGNRFQPQDMDKIEVVPSGLLGPVKLTSFRQ